MAKNRLAIFDLDGTLVKTDGVNYAAYKEALEIEGYSLSKEYYLDNFVGKSWRDFLPACTGVSDWVILNRIHDNKLKIYSKYIHLAELNGTLIDLIRNIKSNYYVAIVTTASKENCFQILEYFKIVELFDEVMTGEDVIKQKPDPEGFIKCMQKFQLSKEHVIIFEDSEIGIEAARNSEVKYLKVFI